MTPCILVDERELFGRTCLLHVPVHAYSLTMEAASYAETSVLTYQTTPCHTQENTASIEGYVRFTLMVGYQVQSLGVSGNGILWNISRQ